MNSLTATDLVAFLPEALARDKQVLTLAQVIAGQFQRTAREISSAVIYGRLEELPGEVLDLLAYDLHADWYDPDAPLEVKRQVLRDSVWTHRRMGTKWAVERLVADYFGGGEVQEWFQYGGQPHHFKIVVDDLGFSGLPMERFAVLLGKVKRKSAWLEALEFIYHVPVNTTFRGILACGYTAVSLFGLELMFFDGAVPFDGAGRFGTCFTRGVRTPEAAIAERRSAAPHRNYTGTAAGRAWAAITPDWRMLALGAGLSVFGLRTHRFDGATRFDGAQRFATEFERGPRALGCGAGYAKKLQPGTATESQNNLQQKAVIGVALDGAGWYRIHFAQGIGLEAAAELRLKATPARTLAGTAAGRTEAGEALAGRLLTLRAGFNVFGLRYLYFDGATHFDGTQAFATEFARGPRALRCVAGYAKKLPPGLAAESRGIIRRPVPISAAQHTGTEVAAPVRPTLRTVAGMGCHAEQRAASSATAETDTMGRMDGTAAFDSGRRWNADIIRYEI